MRAERAGDVFREGMLRIARATTAEERRWLADALDRLEAHQSSD